MSAEVMRDLILTLRVYRGKETYDKDGNINSDSQTFKLAHGRLEWTHFMKTLSVFGYNKIEILKCLDNSDSKDPKEIDIPQEINKEISDAMAGEGKALTPEQQELAAVKEEMAEMKELLKGKTKAAPEKKGDDTPDVNEELESARESYFELTKEKPHHMWKLSTINTKIKEYKNK